MAERLKRHIKEFKNAFNNLGIARKQVKTDLEIDDSIKRFELCYELSWKFMEDKNIQVYSYNFVTSRKVFEHIKKLYVDIFKSFLKKVKEYE